MIWVIVAIVLFAAYIALMLYLVNRAPYQCPECGHLHRVYGVCDACGWDVRPLLEHWVLTAETTPASEHPLLAAEAIVAGWKELTAFLDPYRAPGQSNIAVVRNLAFVHDLVIYLQDNDGLEPALTGESVTGNVSSETPSADVRAQHAAPVPTDNVPSLLGR